MGNTKRLKKMLVTNFAKRKEGAGSVRLSSKATTGISRGKGSGGVTVWPTEQTKTRENSGLGKKMSEKGSRSEGATKNKHREKKKKKKSLHLVRLIKSQVRKKKTKEGKEKREVDWKVNMDSAWGVAGHRPGFVCHTVPVKQGVRRMTRRGK